MALWPGAEHELGGRDARCAEKMVDVHAPAARAIGAHMEIIAVDRGHIVLPDLVSLSRSY